MDEDDQRFIRHECMKLAVESGAECQFVIAYASQYYEYIASGNVPQAEVIRFPAPQPKGVK